MTQKTDGSNRKFKQIKLNINLCNDKSYLQTLETYVRQIFIHEMAHYFYYFKDSHYSVFGELCRKNNTNECTSNDFVSTYAMKNKEEDYAESFTHRYLETTTQRRMIVDQEHGSAETSSRIQEAKNQYFFYTYPSL
jgi:predicted SprT family Zn-dependent metalloprotease